MNLETERLRAEAMDRALSPLPPPWQPIETAPKDGSDFLALCEYHRKHHQMVGCFAPDGKFRSWPGRNHYHPTHWMPLPAPPEASAVSGDRSAEAEPLKVR